MATDVMISTSALSKRFGEVRALDKVSFKVHRGEVVGYLAAGSKRAPERHFGRVDRLLLADAARCLEKARLESPPV